MSLLRDRRLAALLGAEVISSLGTLDRKSVV